MAAYVQIFYNHALAHDRIDLPHGTVAEGKSAEKHPFAPDRLDEVGSEIVTVTEYPFTDGDSILVHFPQHRAGPDLKVCVI